MKKATKKNATKKRATEKRRRRITVNQALVILFDRFVEKLKSREIEISVKDGLKIMELLEKRIEEKSSSEFWSMIEAIRQEELPKMYAPGGKFNVPGKK